MSGSSDRGRWSAWAVSCLCLLWPAASALAQGARLVNEREIFGPEVPYESGRRGGGLGYMRLSPDGKSVLCIRRQVLPSEGGARIEVSRLVLRDLAGGKDRVLPVPPWNWEEGLVRLVSRNVFDPAGKMLVLAGGAATDARGVFQIGSAKMQALVYMLADGQTRKVAATDEMVLPQFDRTGRRLIIMTAESIGGQLFFMDLADWGLRKLSIWGMPMPPSPTEDLLPLFFRDRDEGNLKLVVYDIGADKELAALPVHPSNTLLDQIASQWSPDGRYLYYVDLADPPDGKGPSGTVTRIWDRRTGQMLPPVEDAFPVGPGPLPATMILSAHEKMVLHDATTGESWTLADAPVRIFYAGGGKVVYARPAEGRMYATFVADVQPPAELTTRPMQAPPPITPTSSRPANVPPAPQTQPAPPATTMPANSTPSVYERLERAFGIEKVIP